MFYHLHPVRAVEHAVLNCLRDVLGFEPRDRLQVCDRACHFQDAMVSAGTKSLLCHGSFEHAFAVRQSRTNAFVAHAHGRVRQTDSVKMIFFFLMPETSTSTSMTFASMP